MNGFWHDIRYAVRLLAKQPAFSAVAALTLALGIGANTAIFSVIEGTLLRPLPFPNADRLVRIYEAQDENGTRAASLNLTDRTVSHLKEFGGSVFEDIGAGTGGASVVEFDDNSSALTAPAAQITANFFSVLGLSPAQGRTFAAE